MNGHHDQVLDDIDDYDSQGKAYRGSIVGIETGSGSEPSLVGSLVGSNGLDFDSIGTIGIPVGETLTTERRRIRFVSPTVAGFVLPEGCLGVRGSTDEFSDDVWVTRLGVGVKVPGVLGAS